MKTILIREAIKHLHVPGILLRIEDQEVVPFIYGTHIEFRFTDHRNFPRVVVDFVKSPTVRVGPGLFRFRTSGGTLDVNIYTLAPYMAVSEKS